MDWKGLVLLLQLEEIRFNTKAAGRLFLLIVLIVIVYILKEFI